MSSRSMDKLRHIRGWTVPTQQLAQQIASCLILLAFLMQRDTCCGHGRVHPCSCEAHEERAVCNQQEQMVGSNTVHVKGC